jgi:DNA-binding SARP family transcriptional activator
LEVLSEKLRSCGDHHHAHQAALAAEQTDPLRESAHRTLVELHLADGNPAQAVRQYQSTGRCCAPSSDSNRPRTSTTSCGRSCEARGSGRDPSAAG